MEIGGAGIAGGAEGKVEIPVFPPLLSVLWRPSFPSQSLNRCKNQAVLRVAGWKAVGAVGGARVVGGALRRVANAGAGLRAGSWGPAAGAFRPANPQVPKPWVPASAAPGFHRHHPAVPEEGSPARASWHSPGRRALTRCSHSCLACSRSRSGHCAIGVTISLSLSLSQTDTHTHAPHNLPSLCN